MYLRIDDVKRDEELLAVVLYIGHYKKRSLRQIAKDFKWDLEKTKRIIDLLEKGVFIRGIK